MPLRPLQLQHIGDGVRGKDIPAHAGSQGSHSHCVDAPGGPPHRGFGRNGQPVSLRVTGGEAAQLDGFQRRSGRDHGCRAGRRRRWTSLCLSAEPLLYGDALAWAKLMHRQTLAKSTTCGPTNQPRPSPVFPPSSLLQQANGKPEHEVTAERAPPPASHGCLKRGELKSQKPRRTGFARNKWHDPRHHGNINTNTTQIDQLSAPPVRPTLHT